MRIEATELLPHAYRLPQRLYSQGVHDLRDTNANGRVQSGLMIEQDAASVTLIDGDHRKTRIPLTDVIKVTESGISLVPEGLLENLTPQQVRNLFALIQSSSKP